MYMTPYDHKISETLYTKEHAEHHEVFFKAIKDLESIIMTNFLKWLLNLKILLWPNRISSQWVKKNYILENVSFTQ